VWQPERDLFLSALVHFQMFFLSLYDKITPLYLKYTNGRRDSVIRVLFSVALALVLGWPASGQSEEPPRLRFEWSPSHDTRFSQKTRDGGYIISGQFWVPGGNQYDFWVLKINQNGDIDWQKTYGGGHWDMAFSTQETTDGGYVVSGTTSSFGAGDDDVWILKLDSTGNIVWQKTYGGQGPDRGGDIKQTKDGGYVVTGTTASFGAGSYDIWVLKLNPDGNIVWDKTYGGKEEESGFFRHIPIESTSDGGYIVAGSTRSFGAGDDDFWILKLDAQGNIIWQKTFGTSSEEYPTSVREMEDHTYRITGTESLDIEGDDWILVLDANGSIVGFTSKEGSSITLYDTMVVPKPTTHKTSDSSASIHDTTPDMEGQQNKKSTVSPYRKAE